MSTLTEEARLGNIVRDIMEAAELNPEELDRDLNVLFQLSTALVRCYKAAFDAEGNVRTQQPSRELDIITFHDFVGDGAQTVFPLVNEIDVATELIGFVTLDAVRIFTPADYTFSSTDLTISVAPANGAVGQYAIIQNTAGVIDRIESITAGLGAYLVGFPDDNNLYQATTAGDALDEVMTNLNQLVTDLGLITGLLRNDGSVQLVANWEVNLRKENGTAKAATGTIDVIGTPVHLDTFTIFDGIIGVGNTFQFTAPVLNATGSLEFTGVPTAGDTVTLTDVDGVVITFEYYLNAGPDISAPANTGVELGIDAAGTEASFRTAVGVSLLKISAALNGAAPNPTTDFTQDLPGTAGNTAVTVVGSNMTPTNFVGGLDETNPSYLPVVIGALFTETAANINTTVNESALAVTATNPTPPNARVNIVHDLSSATGNRLITQSGVALNLAGLGGGQNGLLGDLCAAHRIRNLPVSVRDGDVVVHEQLQSLLAVIQTFAGLFVLLDGSSIMNGNFRLGGNKIIDLDDGVDEKDAVNKGQLDAISLLLDQFIPKEGAASADFAGQSQGIGPLSFSRAATDVATVPQDAGAAIATFSGVPLPGAPDHAVNRLHVTNEIAILQSQISNIDSGSGVGGDSPDGSVTLGSSLKGCEIDGTLGDVGDLDGGGVFNFTSMSINAAQTPAADTFIFNNGAVDIGADINMAGKKLEISCTGNFTLSAGATIECGSLIIRAGGAVIINGIITAEGVLIQPAFGTNDVATGNAGFVAIFAVGKCDTGDSSVISTGFCNIQAGASSVMEGLIRASIAITRAGQGSTVSSTLIQNDGSKFGAAAGFFTGSDGVFARYANTGLGGILSPNSHVGGSGGGGGTAGGTGGAGAGGVGGAALLKGTFRPYLYPQHPGGGGSGGTPANFGGTGQDSTPGGGLGGVIVIYIVGDLNALGAVFNANGLVSIGGVGNAGSGGGGGGGGAVRVVCTGEMSNGAASADGGAGDIPPITPFSQGAGGGGGSAHLIANSFTGTPTASAVGGAGVGTSEDGTSDNNVQIDTADIICLAGEGYWAK